MKTQTEVDFRELGFELATKHEVSPRKLYEIYQDVASRCITIRVRILWFWITVIKPKKP